MRNGMNGHDPREWDDHRRTWEDSGFQQVQGDLQLDERSKNPVRVYAYIESFCDPLEGAQ